MKTYGEKSEMVRCLAQLWSGGSRPSRSNALRSRPLMWKRLSVAAVCLCMLFTTACSSTDQNGQAKGEDEKDGGRYAETRLDFPVDGSGPLQMIQRPDGTLDIYCWPEEGGGAYRCYNSPDAESWTEEPVNWKLPYDQHFTCIAYDSKGVAYLLTTEHGGDVIWESCVYRVGADGSLNQISMDWRDENGARPTPGVVPRIQVGSRSIFADQASAGVGQYAMDGRFQRLYSTGGDAGTSSERFTVLGNKLYLIDNGENRVLCYNTDDGSLRKTIAFDNLTKDTWIASGQHGALYLYNRSGVFRLAKGGSLWDKIIDGSLTSLAIPTLHFSDLVEGRDGAFYLSGGDGSTQSQLYKYVYEKSMDTLSKKELNIYSLKENDLLRQTAEEFQRTHPDIRVNLQVAMGEDSPTTRSDLICELNTELLNGKGADVLVLDGLPVDSYMEKGVLADLSETLKDMNAASVLNQTVMNTFKTKDGVFAVPTTFQIPVLITDKASAQGLKDLHSLTAFAQKNGSKPLIGDKSPDHLMFILLTSCAPAWIRDGQVNRDGLKTFLESIKAISDTPAKSYGEQTEGGSADGTNPSVSQSGGDHPGGAGGDTYEDGFHWAFGRSLAFANQMSGTSSMMRVTLAMRKQGNAVMIPLPGQAESVYIPTGIIGINANSKNRDSAEEFLKLALSEKIQTAAANNQEGFAVNTAALNSYVNQTEDYMNFGIYSSYDKKEELDGEMPTPAEKKPLLALCSSVKTPWLADDTLTDAIRREAQDYFAGKKDVDQTISDIQEAIKLSCGSARGILCHRKTGNLEKYS